MTPANQHTGIERLSDERLTLEEIVERVAWKLCYQENEVWDEAPVSYHARWRREAAQMIADPLRIQRLSLRAAEQQEPVSDFERQIHEAIVSRLVSLTVGSCSCSTMTPELKYHAENCRYRIAAEALELARPLYTHPHSSSAVDGRVTEEMAQRAARFIAEEILHTVYEGLGEGNLKDFPLFRYSEWGGWRFQGRKADLRKVAADLLTVALEGGSNGRE